jgi:hypothetical protein
VRCGLALGNLIAGTFLAGSRGSHPRAIPRPFIEQIRDILALDPEPQLLFYEPPSWRNRCPPPRALVFEHVAILLLEDRGACT